MREISRVDELVLKESLKEIREISRVEGLMVLKESTVVGDERDQQYDKNLNVISACAVLTLDVRLCHSSALCRYHDVPASVSPLPRTCVS